LVTLSQADDLRAADNGVKNYETAGEPDGQIQIPAEQEGKNDGRCVDCDPAGDPALNEKQKSAEQPRFFVETLTEIFVGGENFQALVDRHEDRADHNERERLAEIILDKPDAALVGLPRHGEKR